MRKIVVSVAPVGSNMAKEIFNPLAPEEVAKDVIAASQAGASMVHLHVRDRQGVLTKDLSDFSCTLDLIKEKSGIIIQGSTGGVSTLTLEERCAAVNDTRVEVASLNMGSANFDEGVYINTLPDIRYWSSQMNEKGVRPELEVFEAGMIENSIIMKNEGFLKGKLVFAFCLGFTGALPANAYNLQFLRGMLPPDSIWGLIHHGMTDLSLLATAIGMGASFIRVGFEDSIYYAPGKTAKSNAELVMKAVELVKHMGFGTATVKETKEILGISE